MNDGINNPPPKAAEIKAAEIGTAASDFQNLHELVAKARANLNQNAWDYIVGGTETETTLAAQPHVAGRDRVPAARAARCQQGRRIGAGDGPQTAPAGDAGAGRRAGDVRSRAAAAPAVRGAGRFGAAHMLSSVSEPGLENVAKAAPDALRIYQLYVRGDEAFVEDRIKRAIANGYAAFCLTVDTAHYSRRERDLAKRYVRANRRDVSGREFQMALDWRTVKRIKDRYKIPLVIKGIATAEDAAIAVDHGVEWIYVSNHGGRQLDHGRGAMHVLPEIVAAVGGRAKIMVDGSFCRGTDIVKAIAAGADLVGLGRLQCWALAAGGEAGIMRMLELLEDEVQRCLGLLGVNSFAELDKSYLHAAAPTNAPSVFSAFPLLEIEPYRY